MRPMKRRPPALEVALPPLVSLVQPGAARAAQEAPVAAAASTAAAAGAPTAATTAAANAASARAASSSGAAAANAASATRAAPSSTAPNAATVDAGATAAAPGSSSFTLLDASSPAPPLSPDDAGAAEDDAFTRAAAGAAWHPIYYWPQACVVTKHGVIRMPSHGRILPIYATPEAAVAANNAAAAAVSLTWTLPLQTTAANAPPTRATASAPPPAGPPLPPPPTLAAPPTGITTAMVVSPRLATTLPPLPSPTLRKNATPRLSLPSAALAGPGARAGVAGLPATLLLGGGATAARPPMVLRPHGLPARYFTPESMDVLVTADQVAALVRLQAAVRRRLTVNQLASNLERRRQICMEILDTEANYVANLTVLCRYYERPLRARLLGAATTDAVVLEEPEIDRLFGEVSNILDCHDAILRALRARLRRWSYLQSISSAFEVVSDTMRNCYQLFANGYEDASTFLRLERARNPAFAQFLADAQAQSGSRLDIADLLITPIQRLPRYTLLLERLREATHPLHPDKHALTGVLNKVRAIATYMNAKRAEADKRNYVRDVQDALRGPLAATMALVTSTRMYVEEVVIALQGPGSSRSSRHLIVFNDALLCVRVVRTAPRDPTEARLPWGTPVVPLLNRPGAGVSHLALEPDWFYPLDQVLAAVALDKAPLPSQSEAAKAIAELARAEQALAGGSGKPRRGKAPSAKRVESKDSVRSLGSTNSDAADAEQLEQDFVEATDVAQAYKATAALALVVGSRLSSSRILVIMDTDVARDQLRETIARATALEIERAKRVQLEAEALRAAQVLTWRILPRKTEGDRWSFTSFSLQPAITAAAAAADKLRNTSLIHRAHTILRPTASNAARHTPLSVKWTSDVVAVADRYRTVMRLCLLNHQLICAQPPHLSPAAGSDGGSATSGRVSSASSIASASSTLAPAPPPGGGEWVLWSYPVAVIDVTAIDAPPGWLDSSSRDALQQEIKTLQRQLDNETVMLAAVDKIVEADASAASATIARPKNAQRASRVEMTRLAAKTTKDFLSSVEDLKARLARLQRALFLAESIHVVRITVVDAPWSFVVGLRSAEARIAFLERVYAQQNESIHRFAVIKDTYQTNRDSTLRLTESQSSIAAVPPPTQPPADWIEPVSNLESNTSDAGSESVAAVSASVTASSVAEETSDAVSVAGSTVSTAEPAVPEVPPTMADLAASGLAARTLDTASGTSHGPGTDTDDVAAATVSPPSTTLQAVDDLPPVPALATAAPMPLYPTAASVRTLPRSTSSVLDSLAALFEPPAGSSTSGTPMPAPDVPAVLEGTESPQPPPDWSESALIVTETGSVPSTSPSDSVSVSPRSDPPSDARLRVDLPLPRSTSASESASASASEASSAPSTPLGSKADRVPSPNAPPKRSGSMTRLRADRTTPPPPPLPLPHPPPQTPRTASMATELVQAVRVYLTSWMRPTVAEMLSPPTLDQPLYIAKTDHLPEGEDELMLVAGERVVPLKVLTDRCWLAMSDTLVGVVDPRHLLNLTVAGITAVPNWSDSNPDLQRHRAERDQRQESFDHLSFYAGEEIAIVARDLPTYGSLGRYQGIIGWVDSSLLSAPIKPPQPAQGPGAGPSGPRRLR